MSTIFIISHQLWSDESENGPEACTKFGHLQRAVRKFPCQIQRSGCGILFIVSPFNSSYSSLSLLSGTYAIMLTGAGDCDGTTSWPFDYTFQRQALDPSSPVSLWE